MKVKLRIQGIGIKMGMMMTDENKVDDKEDEDVDDGEDDDEDEVEDEYEDEGKAEDIGDKNKFEDDGD